MNGPCMLTVCGQGANTVSWWSTAGDDRSGDHVVQHIGPVAGAAGGKRLLLTSAPRGMPAGPAATVTGRHLATGSNQAVRCGRRPAARDPARTTQINLAGRTATCRSGHMLCVRQPGEWPGLARAHLPRVVPRDGGLSSPSTSGHPRLARSKRGDLQQASSLTGRSAFAKATAWKPGCFQRHSEGACPSCNGIGVIYTPTWRDGRVATRCLDCEEPGGSSPRCSSTSSSGRETNHQRCSAGGDECPSSFFGTEPRRRTSGVARHPLRSHTRERVRPRLRRRASPTTLSAQSRQRLKLAPTWPDKGRRLHPPSTIQTAGLHLADGVRAAARPCIDQARRRRQFVIT